MGALWFEQKAGAQWRGFEDVSMQILSTRVHTVCVATGGCKGLWDQGARLPTASQPCYTLPLPAAKLGLLKTTPRKKSVRFLGCEEYWRQEGTLSKQYTPYLCSLICSP